MKSIISIILFVCMANSAHAQIFEKLADKAAKAAERTVERKVEQKAERETSKAFDSAFNNKKRSKKASKKSKNPVVTSSDKSPKNTYAFTHKYVMQMQSDKYNTTLVYFLAENENYFGSTIESSTTMLNVMDLDKETMFIFTEAGAQKMLMATSLNIDDFTNDSSDNKDVTITKTGNTKKILNYSCTEYKVKGDDFEGSFWVTQDTHVSFPSGFYKINTKKQKSNQQWMSDVKGLTLEMTITNTSKRKPETMTMTCIALEKSDFKINSSEYKKFM